MPVSVRAAVERALSRHQKEALGEVEQILDAAVRVAARVAPAEPKVSEIVTEAGTSNQTFYRYFAGKNDLMRAVLDRGIAKTVSYLQHQMDKQADPVDKVAAWVECLLAQVVRPEVARQSYAVNRLTSAPLLPEPGQPAVEDQLGELLVAPLAAAGRPHPELDARSLQDVVLGVLRRHVYAGTGPGEAERRHLIDFCLTVARSGRD